MRIRPFFFVALGSLVPLVQATGAPASIRDRVEALLTSVSSEREQPEIANAQREAKAALTRAEEARTHDSAERRATAEVLEQTALEWAELSKDLAELAALQTKADHAEQEAQTYEAQLKREKAHLEETEARRGRARAAAESLGLNATDIATDSETHATPEATGGQP